MSETSTARDVRTRPASQSAFPAADGRYTAIHRIGGITVLSPSDRFVIRSARHHEPSMWLATALSRPLFRGDGSDDEVSPPGSGQGLRLGKSRRYQRLDFRPFENGGRVGAKGGGLVA